MKLNGKIELKPIKEILKKRGLESGGRVQSFVDNEVLRQSEPYVPMQTGALKQSGVRHTVIGSGEVRYKISYARKQYYQGRKQGASETGPLRGRKWFERMKNSHAKEILIGAKKLAGAK